mmetsp:Transcript_33096/g.75448  ORF Transcript_33096/g.75448 Transcript_33096/m.75448 type:complete len:200 (-) Transcript_33096:724-1323(-)
MARLVGSLDLCCHFLLWRHECSHYLGDPASKDPLSQHRVPEAVEVLVHQVPIVHMVVEYILPEQKCLVQPRPRHHLQWLGAAVYNDGHHLRVHGARHHLHAISGSDGQLLGDIHVLERHWDSFGVHPLRREHSQARQHHGHPRHNADPHTIPCGCCLYQPCVVHPDKKVAAPTFWPVHQGCALLPAVHSICGPCGLDTR